MVKEKDMQPDFVVPRSLGKKNPVTPNDNERPGEKNQRLPHRS
jgi:hypothetical protein